MEGPDRAAQEGRLGDFTVQARAEAAERPEYWPENSDGYTTGLTVLACDEAEAREFSLKYLQSIEPSPTVRFTLDVVPPKQPSDQVASMLDVAGAVQMRARGVFRVHGQRSYIFRS